MKRKKAIKKLIKIKDKLEVRHCNDHIRRTTCRRCPYYSDATDGCLADSLQQAIWRIKNAAKVGGENESL